MPPTDEEIDAFESTYADAPIQLKHLDAIITGLSVPLNEQFRALEQRIANLEARPEVAYRGVWAEDQVYPAGSLVTRSGGLWLATLQTNARPGEGATSWRLIVKAGKA